MSVLRPLDPAFPIDRQLAVDASPVVLVNVFALDKADEQTFLDAWQDDANFMKRQPGFIWTQLHRAIGKARLTSTTPCGNRPLTSGLRSGIQSSWRNSRSIRPRPLLPRTCSRKSQYRASVSLNRLEPYG